MRVGGVIQLVLLGLFAAVGLAVAVLVAADWLRGLDTWRWEEATCTIDSAQVAEQRGQGGYELRLSYRYRYQGREYPGEAYRHGGRWFERRSEAEVVAGRYQPGDQVRCWVDPEDPRRAYLRRADLWQGLWILVPLLFVAVGVGGIWLFSTLRSAAAAREATSPGAATAGSGSWEAAAGPGGAPPSRRRSAVLVGAMLFLFGAFFLIGTGIFVPFFAWPALQVVRALSWQPVPCEIVSSEVRSHPGEDSTTYSVDVLFRYEVDGREHRSNRYQFVGGSSSGYERRAEIVERLPPGATTTCWVDPGDPREAVIERGFTVDHLFGLLPLTFSLIGLGGLVFAVGVVRGARKDAASPAWKPLADPAAWSWSGEPDAGAAAAAGPMVLEPARGPWGRLGCAVVAALAWNGFISIFLWHIVSEWQRGNPQWGPALILTPFVLIGLLLLLGVPYSLLALVNPRPRVHLSPGALTAGGSAQLEWAFRGAGGRVRHLRIWLEGRETTSSQTDSGFQVETRALDFPPIQVLDRGPELPLEYGSVGFTVPADAPPSSDGEPLVRWRLELHGEIAYWPDVRAEYEVRILPGQA